MMMTSYQSFLNTYINTQTESNTHYTRPQQRKEMLTVAIIKLKYKFFFVFSLKKRH
jgi:hypothetical protein